MRVKSVVAAPPIFTYNGQDGGPDELPPVLHVGLDGGERGGSSEGKHDRAEGFAKTKN